MGYRGKVEEQEQARAMRAEAYTLLEIAETLGVSKSSVSLWVRDVDFEPKPRRTGRWGGRQQRPSRLQVAKQAEIEAMLEEGRNRIGRLADDAFLAAGTALYAGEGSKTDGLVKFANSDPRMMAFFCAWLRRFFSIDESRLRLRLYLHQGLDLDAATTFWCDVTGVPGEQVGKAYRAVPDPSIRRVKHPMGCAYVTYSCSRTHRVVMGLVHALLSCSVDLPG
jgi:transposase